MLTKIIRSFEDEVSNGAFDLVRLRDRNNKQVEAIYLLLVGKMPLGLASTLNCYNAGFNFNLWKHIFRSNQKLEC